MLCTQDPVGALSLKSFVPVIIVNDNDNNNGKNVGNHQKHDSHSQHPPQQPLNLQHKEAKEKRARLEKKRPTTVPNKHDNTTVSGDGTEP